MKDSKSQPRIMIVTGEASGDLHGARLVAAIKKRLPEAHICGMGGTELKKQGVEILYDAARMAVVGLVEVLTHISDIREAKRILCGELKYNTPDLLILIDYPDFNLLLAGKAKKLGIPVFYYISPQVWAWRSSRVKKIGKRVDRMAVILPFERQFYLDRGVEVDYVGHPLLDSVRSTMSKMDFRRRHSIAEQNIVVGILPGSRKKEIMSILPIFLEAAKRLNSSCQNVSFLLSKAASIEKKDLEAGGLADAPDNVRLITEDRYDLMASCDLVMAASGTVTLELAILKIPMIVAYRVSPLTHFMGRKLIKVKYASLVNLIAGREVVPEFLQKDASPENIAAALQTLWPGCSGREKMLNGLEEVKQKLGGGGASEKAADIALETMAAG